MSRIETILLDRDGTLIEERHYLRDPGLVALIPGVAAPMRRLAELGCRFFLASNQSGIGRGLFDMHALNAMHEKMHRLVNQAGGRIDAVIFCPHVADDQCDCRKPKPGMVHEVMERFNVRGDGLPMIGDSLRDLQAVAEVGGLPLLVRTGKGLRTLEKGGLPAGTQVFDDLFDAADYLINLED